MFITHLQKKFAPTSVDFVYAVVSKFRTLNFIFHRNEVFITMALNYLCLDG